MNFSIFIESCYQGKYLSHYPEESVGVGGDATVKITVVDSHHSIIDNNY